MMTGDYINHVDWKYTIKEHQEVLQKIGGLIKKNFFTTPTYWAIGNHEGVPVNRFSVTLINKLQIQFRSSFCRRALLANVVILRNCQY